MTKNENNQPSQDQVSLIAIFAQLSPALKQTVSEKLHRKTCSKGETIIQHKDDSREVYFILDGGVRVTFFSSRGRQVTFRDLGQGEMFGELSAIDGEPRSTHVVTTEDSELAWTTHSGFNELLTSYPDISLSVMEALTTNVRRLTGRVVEFSTMSVKVRVRAELFRLAQLDSDEATEEMIVHAITHEDIATRISTHREAVTREIGDLVRSGILTKRGRNLVIERPDALLQDLEFT